MKPFVCKKHGPVDPHVYLDEKGHAQRHCRECRKENSRGRDVRASRKLWADAHPSYQRDWKRDWRAKVRAEIVAVYGGECACCKEREPRFLTVDHVNNDGKAHRATFKNAFQIYSWLKAQGFPREGFRLLCFNCNLGRALAGGICPHEKKADVLKFETGEAK